MELREHLVELRNRIVKAAVFILLGAIAGWFLYDPTFHALARPMQEVAQAENRPVEVNFQGVGSAFDMKIRVSAFLGLLISSPFWIYQIWAFITPGLTRKERRYALAFMFTAVPLFLSGAALAYFAMQNFVRFLIDFTPEGASNIIAFDVYLDFVMRVILSFGLSFLLPVILVAINLMGVVSGRTMLKAWRWVVVVAFAFAAIATPTPDVTSMFLLAAPLLLLFFVAIGIAILNDKKRARRAAKEMARAEASSRIAAAEAIDAPDDIARPDQA